MASTAQKLIWLGLTLWLTSCGKTRIAIDDASKPFTLTLTAPERVYALELTATGQIWGHGRLLLFRGDELTEPWRTIDITPVAISGIEIAIREASIESEFYGRKLTIRYEPNEMTQGRLEIVWRFEAH